MNFLKNQIFYLIIILFSLLIGCSDKSADIVELKHYPMDSTEGLITQSDVRTDTRISSDQKASVRITANQPTIVRLYEVRDIDVENARLTYQAKLRTEALEGTAYLEMWCHFPGKGEFFSRAVHSPLSGTTEWVSQETPFFLKKGEKPDYVSLNLVIEGNGTVWIDDIRLIKSR